MWVGRRWGGLIRGVGGGGLRMSNGSRDEKRGRGRKRIFGAPCELRSTVKLAVYSAIGRRARGRNW